MAKPTAKVVKLRDLILDDRNANKGTARGLAMLDDSLREDGAGRGILIDRNNRVIGGNKTVERAIDDGFDEIIIVPTDGKQLVATQRVDVDLDTPQGRRMAIRDNRIAQVDLEFDPDVLMGFAEEGIDLAQFWNDGELAVVLGQGDDLDYEKARQGMPGFTQENVNAFKSIIVHFDSETDLIAFSKLLGQLVTPKTKSIWYPPKPDQDLKGFKVHEQS